MPSSTPPSADNGGSRSTTTAAPTTSASHPPDQATESGNDDAGDAHTGGDTTDALTGADHAASAPVDVPTTGSARPAPPPPPQHPGTPTRGGDSDVPAIRPPATRTTASVPRGPAPVVAILDFLERLITNGHTTEEAAKLYIMIVKPWQRTVMVLACLLAFIVTACLIAVVLVPQIAVVLAVPAGGALFGLAQRIRAWWRKRPPRG